MGKIRFYLNESVNIAVASGLRRRGVHAITAKDSGNLGISDIKQLEYSSQNDLVIVTHDDDFLSFTNTVNAINNLIKMGFRPQTTGSFLTCLRNEPKKDTPHDCLISELFRSGR